MSYTIDYLKKFTPTGYHNPIHVSPDAQSLFHYADNNINFFKINHYLATLHLEGTEADVLEYSIVESILKKPLPNPQQQVDNLIRLLSKFDRAIAFQGNDKFEYYTGSQHPDMFDALIEHLLDRKWIKGHQDYANNDRIYYGIMLTIQGWEHFTQLQKGEISYNKGFMAMQFSNDDLQNILDDYFKPAIKRIGFELTKLDDNHKSGLIDTRMLVEIQTSDFIVADLSDNNRGVYFEAGYAMGLGKTVIFTCEKTKWKKRKPHFDVNHYMAILWSKDTAKDAAKQLALAVRAEFPDKVKISDDA